MYIIIYHYIAKNMTIITIPRSGVKFEAEQIEIDRNLIIIGANGSGKTRFGGRIRYDCKDIEIHKVKKDVNGYSLNYDAMLSYIDCKIPLKISANRRLITEIQFDNETDLNSIKEIFSNSLRLQDMTEEQSLMESILHSLWSEESLQNAFLKVWNVLFPNRPVYFKIKKEEGLLVACKFDKNKEIHSENGFHPRLMSDGEKSGLYLIGSVIVAPKNSVFVIDEPEIHLHKALMTKLWNELEKAREDCTFIYITHDLDFASKKSASKILWMESYEYLQFTIPFAAHPSESFSYYENVWKWQILEQNKDIPNALYFEILGDKDYVLFVEGDKNSLDNQIYQEYYKDFKIVPSGSCANVIKFTKSINQLKDLHKKGYGIIDKDFETKDRIEDLEKSGIYSIKVNTVENLFILPEIIEMLDEDSNFNDSVKECIKKNYRDKKKEILEETFKKKALDMIKNKFRKDSYDDFKNNINELFKELDKLNKNIELQLPKDEDIEAILKICPAKYLINIVENKVFQKSKKKVFQKSKVIQLFRNTETEAKIRNILKKYLPEITNENKTNI